MSKTIADPTLLATHMAELADKRIDILRRIGDVGSISEAARRAGVSYKAAWQAIETLNNLAGAPLVEKVVGGNKGGGTRLTATGEEVLKLADELTRARAEVLVRFRLKDSPALKNVGVSSLRTSMRNQFPAVIEKLKQYVEHVRMRQYSLVKEYEAVRLTSPSTIRTTSAPPARRSPLSSSAFAKASTSSPSARPPQWTSPPTTPLSSKAATTRSWAPCFAANAKTRAANAPSSCPRASPSWASPDPVTGFTSACAPSPPLRPKPWSLR